VAYADAAPKSTTPACMNPLRPNRSLRVPAGEEQPGEDERVGVDHPLLLAVGEAQCLRHLRQRDVEGRVADDDDQQAGAQHAEDHPTPAIDVGWDLVDVVVVDECGFHSMLAFGVSMH
jgi:hypothetical protein